MSALQGWQKVWRYPKPARRCGGGSVFPIRSGNSWGNGPEV